MSKDEENATELEPLAADGSRQVEITAENKRDERGGEVMTATDHVKEYCSCTSIHGVQYLIGRPLTERLLWIAVLLVSFVGNSYLVSRVWIKWNESPVIVTFAETPTPVWEIPFPAVTICPMTKYRATDYDMRSIFEKEDVTENDIPQWIKDVSLVCDEDVYIDYANTTTEAIYYNLREYGPDFNDTIQLFNWKGKQKDPGVWIGESVTSDGICYTFNGLSRSEIFRPDSVVEGYERDHESGGWTPEAGYPEEVEWTGEAEFYPLRVLDSGVTDGLTLAFLDITADFDYWCNGFTPGFKIIFHNPGSVPSVNKKYFILESGQQALVGVEPDVVRTSETLRGYSPKMRQCYFSDERYLQHFKIYTQSNCELECRTNYTLRICGCVNFHMPRANSSIPICGAAMKICVDEVRGKLRDIERKLGSDGCHCLPSCSTIRYKLDVTQNKFDWTKSPLAENVTNLHEGILTFSTMAIYYTDSQFIASQRNELYGLVDFLANCGGLIGLFSGFSVLSIVEIFYFLTIRGYNNLFWKNE